MDDSRLLDDRSIDSALLREATDKLNFIWGLAQAYRAPGLLRWLDTLSERLVAKRDFLKTQLQSRRTVA